jgi:hypothetical protein
MATPPPTVGERIGDLGMLDYYRKVRRSVCDGAGNCRYPAAVLMRMQAHDVHRRLCNGLYAYVPQRRCQAFPKPAPKPSDATYDLG